MSIFEKIKGPKHLKRDHWRFKIIEWVLHKSYIPDYMYKHYCPLFWTSNAFVVFLPLICFIKLFINITIFLSQILVKPCFSFIGNKIFKYYEKYENVVAPNYLYSKMLTVIESYQEDYDQDNDRDKNHYLNFCKQLFNRTYWSRSLKFNFSSDEELEEMFDRAYTDFLFSLKIQEENKKEEKKYEKKRKKDMLNLVRLSEVFIKILAIPIILFLVIAVFYCLTFYILPFTWMCVVGILTFLGYLISVVNSFDPLIVFAKIITYVSFGALFYIIFKYTPIKNKFSFNLESFSNLKSITSDITKAFSSYVKSLYNGFLEFCSMFFSRNCPPIILEDETNVNE